MGMYTEIVANFPLVDDVPEIVVDVLNYLSGNTENMPENIPEHGFFKCSRWAFVLNMSSFYFVPFSNSKFKKELNTWYLSARADLKNYDDEIGQFFDWVNPYVDEPDGVFLGYSRYEEDDEPKLYYKTQQ